MNGEAADFSNVATGTQQLPLRMSDARPFHNQGQTWLNQDNDEQRVTEHLSWGGAFSHQAFKEDDGAGLLLSQSGKKVWVFFTVKF